MLKSIAILEFKKNERVYQLHLPPESPLGEVHDVLMEARQFVIDRINEAVKPAKPAEEIESVSN